MNSRRIMAVTGATGARGGGRVRAMPAGLQARFAVPAIARNPDCENARALPAVGAEVVAGNLVPRERNPGLQDLGTWRALNGARIPR